MKRRGFIGLISLVLGGSVVPWRRSPAAETHTLMANELPMHQGPAFILAAPPDVLLQSIEAQEIKARFGMVRSTDHAKAIANMRRRPRRYRANGV